MQADVRQGGQGQLTGLRQMPGDREEQQQQRHHQLAPALPPALLLPPLLQAQGPIVTIQVANRGRVAHGGQGLDQGLRRLRGDGLGIQTHPGGPVEQIDACLAHARLGQQALLD